MNSKSIDLKLLTFLWNVVVGVMVVEVAADDIGSVRVDYCFWLNRLTLYKESIFPSMSFLLVWSLICRYVLSESNGSYPVPASLERRALRWSVSVTRCDGECGGGAWFGA